MEEGRRKILHILTVRFGKNGVTRCAMNYITHLPDAFACDLACGFPLPAEAADAFAARGAKAVSLPPRLRRPVSYFLALKRLVRAEGYDAVHVHGNSCTMALELLAARRGGVPVRLPHAHNTVCSFKLLHRLLRPAFERSRTAAFACGEAAGRFLYGDAPFTIVRNAIDTDEFAFSEEARARMRTALHLDGRFVLGHIGSFNAQKNHAFLWEIFLALRARCADAALLCAGDGPERENIERAAAEAGLTDSLIVLRASDDPAGCYCAMDAFALPSRYEGLPFTLLEAQANGLPCYASAAVTREANLSGRVGYLPEGAVPAQWADAILSGVNAQTRAADSLSAAACIRAAGYDIAANAAALGALYETMIRSARP